MKWGHLNFSLQLLIDCVETLGTSLTPGTVTEEAHRDLFCEKACEHEIMASQDKM